MHLEDFLADEALHEQKTNNTTTIVHNNTNNTNTTTSASDNNNTNTTTSASDNNNNNTVDNYANNAVVYSSSSAFNRVAFNPNRTISAPATYAARVENIGSYLWLWSDLNWDCIDSGWLVWPNCFFNFFLKKNIFVCLLCWVENIGSSYLWLWSDLNGDCIDSGWFLLILIDF